MQTLTEIATQITQLEDYRTHHLQDDLSRAQQEEQQQEVTTPKWIPLVQNKFTSYQSVNLELSKLIRNSTPPDLGERLSKIGANQQRIDSLRKEIAQAKVDLETAEERDTQVHTDQPQVSEYQGISKYFGIVKPIHFISVPILLGVSLFIFIMSILLIKDYFLLGMVSSGGLSGLSGLSGTISTSVFRDPRIWATLFGASLIVILFLVLKVTNKLPLLQ